MRQKSVWTLVTLLSYLLVASALASPFLTVTASPSTTIPGGTVTVMYTATNPTGQTADITVNFVLTGPCGENANVQSIATTLGPQASSTGTFTLSMPSCAGTYDLTASVLYDGRPIGPTAKTTITVS
jgi:hypothetical protein